MSGRPTGGVARRGVPRDERGAALVIALVLVLVGTLVGIAAMETSGIETRLVANEGFRLSAFRAAESAAERGLFDVDPGTLPEDAPVTLVPTVVDPRVSVALIARAQGQSLKLGFSSRVLVNTLYTIEATATIDAVDARRTVVQGAAVPSVPSAPR